MSTAVLQMSGLLDEKPQSVKRNTQATVRASHDRALAALESEPLTFPSITSLPPMKGWSSTTIDLPTVKKALRHLVIIKKDTDGDNFYRCSGLELYDGGLPEDGCGHTEDDALMSYMKTLMQFDPANFMQNGKRLEWTADYHRFHVLGTVD